MPCGASWAADRRPRSGGGLGSPPGPLHPPLVLHDGVREAGQERTPQKLQARSLWVNSGPSALPATVPEAEADAGRPRGELTALVLRCTPGGSGCPGLNLALLPPSCVTLPSCLTSLGSNLPAGPYPGAVLVPNPRPGWSEVLGVMLPDLGPCSDSAGHQQSRIMGCLLKAPTAVVRQRPT